MSVHNPVPPRAPGDAVDEALGELLRGPTPSNTVHGAIELGCGGAVPGPSDASAEAARLDILAALWGPSW